MLPAMRLGRLLPMQLHPLLALRLVGLLAELPDLPFVELSVELPLLRWYILLMSMRYIPFVTTSALHHL
jgi:hypothetical protein